MCPRIRNTPGPTADGQFCNAAVLATRGTLTALPLQQTTKRPLCAQCSSAPRGSLLWHCRRADGSNCDSDGQADGRPAILTAWTDGKDILPITSVRGGWDSSVATGWTVRGSNPGGTIFFAHVQTGPGTQPASYTMGTGSFPGVKRQGHGADHPPPCSAEVKKE
jgi:hypothetical protein